MGTTCTVVVIVGLRLYLAHVGDTRAYVVRGRHIHQLSIDHTWAEEALEAARSPEDIRTHPNRNAIKRFLGIDPDMEVDTRYVAVSDSEGRTSRRQDRYRDSAEEPLLLEAVIA